MQCGAMGQTAVSPGEWQETTVGRLLSFSNGKSSPERCGSLPHPVYGSNGIIGFADRTNASPNTIIIGRVGSYCGSLHYSDDICWVTDNAIRANVVDDNDARFVFYLLHTLRLNDWRSGSGQPLLNQTILSSIPAEIPGPLEQRAIAHVLGTLDDKIELNRRMNQTLEEMARALFKSWFVDFDPVRAKAALKQHALGDHSPLAGEPSGNAAAPAREWTVERARAYLAGIDQQIANLFPDRLVDSELGKIPEGWKILPLSSLATIKGGRQLASDKITKDGLFPVYGGAGLMGYTYSFNADGYVISVGRVGAYCGQFFSHRGKAWINNNASLISPHDESSGEWLLHALQTLDLDSIKKGAAQPFVSNGDLADMKVVYPGDRAKNAFHDAIVGQAQRADSNQCESETLRSSRATLLPKLMSGMLRVDVREDERGFQFP